MIDPAVLKNYVRDGVEFWCDADEQRIALLEALDELGYHWYSGPKLLALTRPDYQVTYGVYNGISYMIHAEIKAVTKGRNRKESAIPVSDLMDSAAIACIDQSDLLNILFETEATA